MLIQTFASHVKETVEFADKTTEERRRIAIYGLVSEIGSVLSAVKKQKLSEAGTDEDKNALLARTELTEELGDVMWYCFALIDIVSPESGMQILENQISILQNTLNKDDDFSIEFRANLPPENLSQFLEKADTFTSAKDRTFNDYEDLAILTARTEGKELIETCLALLMQASAQMVRSLISERERGFNDEVIDKDPIEVLGDIAWYLTAIAKSYNLRLEEIANYNIKKTMSRRSAELKTPLHDEKCIPPEQFPRHFEIKFLTIGNKRSRMYLDGRQLGDDLTDNSHEADGYRFHDILHLANVAHLGWSPIIRRLMKRKRKRCQEIDEVEDGARAAIIEEAVLKIIHSEGARISKITDRKPNAEERPMFTNDIEIPLSLLKLIRRCISGLEVDENSFAEWKSAIRDGFKIYYALCKEKQGTVSLDLDKRSMTFKPEVYVDLAAAVSGIGSCAIPLGEFDEDQQAEAKNALTLAECERFNIDDPVELAKVYAVKCAILQAAGIDGKDGSVFQDFSLALVEEGKYSVKAERAFQVAMWKHGTISFKTSVAKSQNSVYCTALAACDTPA
jgi:NTP pyrophosphatase (non-canonical NTP hydrolase)/phosphopantetheinyl transferase (holo-ACP synthase)